MIRPRYAVILVSACALLLSIGKLRLLAQTIKFEVPAVVDPIHTNGEPDIAIDPSGRVFVSGPTGTGKQRSAWFGSVDRGHTFRITTPGPAPTAITGIIDAMDGGEFAAGVGFAFADSAAGVPSAIQINLHSFKVQIAPTQPEDFRNPESGYGGDHHDCSGHHRQVLN